MKLRHAIEQATGNELVFVVDFDKEEDAFEVLEVYARNTRSGACTPLDADQFNKQIDAINWWEVYRYSGAIKTI